LDKKGESGSPNRKYLFNKTGNNKIKDAIKRYLNNIKFLNLKIINITSGIESNT
tara:strand:+ start:441 stop:602 length:162 start_codon:yes stop_codon:yes gene_type:complete